MCAFLKVRQMTTSDPDCNMYRNLRTELRISLFPKTKVYVCLRMPVGEGNHYPGVFIIQLLPLICKDNILPSLKVLIIGNKFTNIFIRKLSRLFEISSAFCDLSMWLI